MGTTAWAAASAASAERGAAPRRAHAAVIAGKTIPASAAPWLVWVQRNPHGQFGGDVCTGTVVSTNVVLTAAHCVVNLETNRVYPSDWFVIANGDVDVRPAHGLRTWKVAKIGVFPSSDYFFDAAVLVASAPLAKPALALASGTDLRSWAPGTRAVAYGWGLSRPGARRLTGRITEGTLVVQSPQYCTAHATADPGWTTAAQFCGLDPRRIVAACLGDSGGPLVVTGSSGRKLEVGIDSIAGSASCVPTAPSFYARVDAVSPWVRRMVAAAAPRRATRHP